MATKQVGAGPDIFCGLCRHLVDAEGVCSGCGELPRTTFVQKPAWDLVPGAQIVEADGALVEVTSVQLSTGDAVGMRGRSVVIGIKCFGCSRPGPITVSARRLFSVLREVA